MVQERLFVSLDAYIQTDVWRCTNCGDITDKVILTNRQAKGVTSEFPKMNQAA
jgi:hypothetical protein